MFALQLARTLSEQGVSLRPNRMERRDTLPDSCFGHGRIGLHSVGELEGAGGRRCSRLDCGGDGGAGRLERSGGLYFVSWASNRDPHR